MPNDCNFQLRIFQNQPNTLDFDKADSMEAAQDVEITEKNLSGDIILLKFVKFQNVTNLQFFFKVYQIQMSKKQTIFGNLHKSINNQQNRRVILWLTW